MIGYATCTNNDSPVCSSGKINVSSVTSLTQLASLIAPTSPVGGRKPLRRHSSTMNSQSVTSSRCADDTDTSTSDRPDRRATLSLVRSDAPPDGPPPARRTLKYLFPRDRSGPDDPPPPLSPDAPRLCSRRSSSSCVSVRRHFADRRALSRGSLSGGGGSFSDRRHFAERRSTAAAESSLGDFPMDGIFMPYAGDLAAELDPEAEALEETVSAPVPWHRSAHSLQSLSAADALSVESRAERNRRISENCVSILRQMASPSRSTPSRWLATQMPYSVRGDSMVMESLPSVEDLSFSLPNPQRFSLSFTHPFGTSVTSEAISAMRSGTTPAAHVGVAGTALREKHLKRVSCYILGPLFGEGAYGVVRDAIDMSTNHTIPPRFQRVAVKSFKYRRRSSFITLSTPRSASVQRNSSIPSSFLLSSSQSKPQDAKMELMFETEMSTLQRFHCPTIIRAIDVFTRHDKNYAVFPIAVCNIAQLVEESRRFENLSDNEPSTEATAHSLDLKTRTTTPKAGRAEVGKTSPPNPLNWMNASSVESSKDDTVKHGISHKDKPSNNGEATSPKGIQGNINALTPPCSAALVKGIIYQILYGLVYLHRQGLAHNDIKPQNILLFHDGLLKISDLGSVGEVYNDGGTPMYTSPEVCRYYYHATDSMSSVSDSSRSSSPSSGRSSDDESGAPKTCRKSKADPLAQLDAQKNDMWACGLILYYLLTGRHLWSHHACGNRFQLYRHIAAQRDRGALSFSRVLEPCADALPVRARWANAAGLRGLLGGLLALDPAARLTAAEALRHAALRSELSAEGGGGGDAAGQALLEAVKADVASRTVQAAMLRAWRQRDREQHLQFVADCCYILGIAMPREIFKGNALQGIMGSGEDVKDVHNQHNDDTNNTVMPCGTVDATLFTSVEDQRYYERKLGAKEYDVRFMLTNPIKVFLMQNYFYCTVLVDCGYITAEAAQEQQLWILDSNERNIKEGEHSIEGSCSSGDSAQKKKKKRRTGDSKSGEVSSKRKRSRSHRARARETGWWKKIMDKTCFCAVM